MTTLEDRDRSRVAFLLALYEAVDGSTKVHTNFRIIGERIGLGDPESSQVMQWLIDRNLLEAVAFGGSIAITARGVDEAEDRLRKGASVPQSVLILSVEEQRAVEAFLTKYRMVEESGVLPWTGDLLLEADAEVRTIEAQLRSPKPKRRVIRASLRELHGIGQSAVGSGVWVGAWELLQKLLNTV